MSFFSRIIDPVDADRERVARKYQFTADSRAWLVPLAIGAALLLGLAGCSLFGEEDFDGLAPGTFRMEAEGETIEGTATFYPNIDQGFSEAQIILETSGGSSLGFGSDQFLTAEVGDAVTPRANYRPSNGGHYLRDEGTVRITYADSTRIEGTFRFRMLDRGGPLAVREITVEGGFNAPVEE